jgi:hypothetical protein
VAGYCEHCNELSGIIKGGEFLDYLSDYWLLKLDSALWSWLVSSRGLLGCEALEG